MLRITVLIAVAMCVPLAGHARADAALDGLVRDVLHEHPSLEAIEAEADALQAAVEGSDVWMDPIVAAEYSNMPITEPWPGNHAMSGVQLKVQQTFPWPGKTGARRSAARARIAPKRLELAERRNELSGWVRRVYQQLALVRRLRAITAQHRGLVERYIEIVRASYEIGGTGQSDLMRLQVLRDKLDQDLRDHDRQDRELIGLLNAAARRAADTPIETPEHAAAPKLDDDALDALVKRAGEHRPLLKQLVASARAERLTADQADREGAPDITAWVGYRIRVAVPQGDPGEDFITAGVSMPLPWFWNDARWGSKAQEHRARADGLEAKRRAMLDDIRGQLAAALARWRRAAEKADDYHSKLVPSARGTVDATLAAYQVGRAEFASLLQAELTLLDFERAIRIAETEALLARVDVDVLLGSAEHSKETP
jgi:outer membrane protein TolC